MNYRVVTVPMPSTSIELEDLINRSVPPGHELVAITIDDKELILVYRSEQR